MPEELVSIIIPCYNNAPYLRKCIDSVLCQSYNNTEIIVVDDGSSDEPKSVISDYVIADKIKYVKLSHSGVSTARNAGMQKATGEYIIFIDGDDWVEPNHIETLVNGADGCDGSMIVMTIDKDGESSVPEDVIDLFSNYEILSKEIFYLLYERYLLSSPCNKIYQSEIIRKHDIRFDPNVSYAEDLLFNLTYFQYISSVRLNSKVTYHYIKHSCPSGTTRYHQNTVATLEKLSTATHHCFNNPSDEVISIEMQHYLWGILNIFHPDAHLSSKQRRNVINQIQNLAWWNKYKKALPKHLINPILYYLLMYGNAYIIEKALSKRKFQ